MDTDYYMKGIYFSFTFNNVEGHEIEDLRNCNTSLSFVLTFDIHYNVCTFMDIHIFFSFCYSPCKIHL